MMNPISSLLSTEISRLSVQYNLCFKEIESVSVDACHLQCYPTLPPRLPDIEFRQMIPIPTPPVIPLMSKPEKPKE